MESILAEVNKVRQKLKKGVANILLLQKPFANGMYHFSMFMISYYTRVRENLKIDYDSFMIIQTVVSHNLYHLQKKNGSKGYDEIDKEWFKNSNKHSSSDEVTPSQMVDTLSNFNISGANHKLSISSICLVTTLPKETVRRKVNLLCKKNLLKNSRKQGILLGPAYKKIFQNFVPETSLGVSKLLKSWEKSGVLKGLLDFKF